MSLKAKFNCSVITRAHDHEVVTLNAVYSVDKTSENYAWSQWTPSGTVSMTITNPAALGTFEPGKDYFLTFEEAP